MCRGGKDGITRRCELVPEQHVANRLRKRIKYRADKVGLSASEWQKANPEEVSKLRNALTALLSHTQEPGFQASEETRRLAEGIPMDVREHMAASEAHITETLTDIQKIALSGYTGFAAGICNVALWEGTISEERLNSAAPPWRTKETGPTDFATKEDLEDYMTVVDTALSQREENRRILYRGIPIYREIHAELETIMGQEFYPSDTSLMLEALSKYYAPGKVMEFPNYVSTTHSAYYAADRTSEISGTDIEWNEHPEVKGIQIELKTNAGLDVTGIARHHSAEREVILPRGTRFRVENIILQPESYDTVSGYDFMNYPDELQEENFKGIAIVVQMVEVDDKGNEITHTEPHIPEPLKLS